VARWRNKSILAAGSQHFEHFAVWYATLSMAAFDDRVGGIAQSIRSLTAFHSPATACKARAGTINGAGRRFHWPPSSAMPKPASAFVTVPVQNLLAAHDIHSCWRVPHPVRHTTARSDQLPAWSASQISGGVIAHSTPMVRMPAAPGHIHVVGRVAICVRLCGSDAVSTNAAAAWRVQLGWMVISHGRSTNSFAGHASTASPY
jgi:hypothetical protein